MNGVVYKVDKDGTGYEVLRRFTGGLLDGSTPYAAVVEGSDGALYGTTFWGGSSGNGVVFRLSLD